MAFPSSAGQGAGPGPAPRSSAGGSGFLPLLATLLLVLLVVFRESFSPGMAMFANDGPLGLVSAAANRLPEAWSGVWNDLNWLGVGAGSAPLGFTSIAAWVLGPLGFINFYPALTILALGLSAWLFFRQLGFDPPVAFLGGIAAALNSDFFSYACWGLGTLTLTVASVFLALAALSSRRIPAWTGPVLAGVAVGNALIEGFDNGAIFSLYVAAFAMFRSWQEDDRTGLRRLGRGVVRTLVVAAVAGLVAAHILIGLIQGNMTRVATPEEEAAAAGSNSDANWNFATQWSLPPIESLRTMIPGLYGYRMDTANGGEYWGRVGMDPAWDAYWAAERRDPRSAPQALRRFSGAGHYAGVLVVLLAVFALAQSLRSESALNASERRWVWFWTAVALGSLLLAFGRFAPFYRLVYALPYFNSIRNPVKYLHPFSVALVVLFAYGLQALWRGWIRRPEAREGGLAAMLKGWWPEAETWEKRWTLGTLGVAGGTTLAWLIYRSAHGNLVEHLGGVGFATDEANAIALFSQNEVGIFVACLWAATGLVIAVLAGMLSGNRAKLAAWLVAGFVVVDLACANTPWIVHYDWRGRYASNPVIDILRVTPHEARVTGHLPFSLQGRAGQVQNSFVSYYQSEWLQHPFRFHNVQSLDVVQMPRTPADYAAYRTALEANPVREWELGNVRHVLALAGVAEALNEQLDGGRGRFLQRTGFNLLQSDDGAIHLKTNAAGALAVIEFTGALPRAMLFDRWRSAVPDDEALQLLGSTNFNPHTEVLVAEQIPAPAVDVASQPAGTATFQSYSPKRSKILTEARTPCVLLVNDKHDPDWHVFVDGKEEPLLRANFIVRGVYLTPGRHEVEFRFEPPMGTFWLSAVATLAGLALCGYVAWWGRRRGGE